ncbi:MAG: hypothetical protein RLZZ623_2193 [Actinomycetota bacterium]|jgi:hypothetical protein
MTTGQPSIDTLREIETRVLWSNMTIRPPSGHPTHPIAEEL